MRSAEMGRAGIWNASETNRRTQTNLSLSRRSPGRQLYRRFFPGRLVGRALILQDFIEADEDGEPSRLFREIQHLIEIDVGDAVNDLAVKADHISQGALILVIDLFALLGDDIAAPGEEIGTRVQKGEA